MTDRNILNEEPIMGPEKLCRGCAGSGLRYDFPTRARQLMERVVIPSWRDPISGTQRRQRTIPMPGEIAPLNPYSGLSRITDMRWSLNDILVTLETMRGMGADVPDDVVPFGHKDACAWCHGTGVPQLSAATMRGAVHHA